MGESSQSPYAAPQSEIESSTPSSASTKPVDGPVGVGGWLGVYVIGNFFGLALCVLMLNRDLKILLMPNFSQIFGEGGRFYHPLFLSACIYRAVFAAVSMLVIVGIFYLMHKKSAKLVPVVVTFLSLQVIGGMVNVFLLNKISGEFSDFLSLVKNSDPLAVIPPLLWIAYFLKSKRVKNTFVK